MVRRRLNKKVAFIGSAFFVIIALGFIIVLLQFSRSPLEFIKDAETAIQTARQSTDKKIKEQYYDIAIRKYNSAYSRVKTNQERKEILFDMVNLFIETKDWPYVLDCWEKILLIEPDNIRAQYGRLRYFEILGDSGIPNVWTQTYEYASQFLKIAQENKLMDENISNLQIQAMEQEHNESQKLGTYLYLTRGKGALEQANTGAVTNTEEILNKVIDDFEKAKELEPDNIDAYLCLAKAVITKGEFAATKGSVDEREKAKKQVLALLEQGVSNSTNKVKAYVNLVNYKVVLARENEPEAIEEQFKTLESEYESLTNRFSSSAEVYEALSQFYWIYSQYTKLDASRQNLDKSIDAISNAMKLDENNAVYAIQITDLYYKRSSIYKNEPDLAKAIEIAKNALSWPDAQNTPGPGNNIRIGNKFLLNTFLANCYIEKIINSGTAIEEADRNTLLSEAQQAIHEIEMILRTSEDPMVIKWHGMLELAKGNKQEAIVKLNRAYEQSKATKPAQPPWPLDVDFARLSYTLAQLFMDTEEIGKVHEFLIDAHYSGITEIKPEARLDYVEVILRFNHVSDALENIDAFEADYGPNKRSRDLRVWTYIYSNKYEEAEKELDKMPSSDADTIQLRLALAESRIRQIQMSLAQKERQNTNDPNEIRVNQLENTNPEIPDLNAKEDIKVYTQIATGLLEKLLGIKPELVEQSSVINICRTCISNNDIQQAKRLVETYLTKFPDNIALNIYKQILSEPEPAKITQQRYMEIEEKTLSGISDPIKRAANLGIFYKRNNEIPRAIEQLKIALEAADSIEITEESPEMGNIRLAASHLFEIALSTGKQDIAENLLKIARQKNLDGFKGLFYDAQLTASKNDFKNALIKADECLKEYPISSQLYMLRSSINAALGNEYAYMEDISKAAYLNPLDGTIARRLAIALYERDQNSKNEISSAQVNETRNALVKAIALNQGDLELRDIYTEYIALTEPGRAIAIRQDMLSAVPVIDNAVKLGMLAMNVAMNTSNPDDKEVYFDIADSAFEQARKMDPNDRNVLLYYAEYLRARGRDEQAKKLLEESKDSLLIANDLFQKGDFENARKILEEFYSEDSNNIQVLRGLMLVAQKINDKESVKKYSEELLSVENSATNLILQIKAFITVGLFTDAEYKLQSLKERYPDETSVSMLQAWLIFKQGNAKKALDIINNYLQVNKTSSAAWRLRSEINFELNEYDRAISDLKTSKSLSDDPSIGILLANVYIQISKFEEAEAELKEILSEQNPPMEAYLLLENIYLQFNRKTALENLYNSIIEKHPDSVQWRNRAAAYALQTGEFERAEKLYKKSCEIIRESYIGDKQGKEIDDDLYVASFDGYLQVLLEGTGDIDKEGSHPEKSETVIQEAGKYTDSSYAPLAYFRMTMAFLKLRKEDDAEKTVHLALEKALTNEKYAFRTMQDIYPILGLDAIVKNCSKMLEKNPDSLAANYTMYYVLRYDKKYEESAQYIDKCIDLVEKDSPIRFDYIMKKDEMLLFAYADTSDNKYINAAIDDYQSLLSEMPNNIQVLNNLAFMLAQSNQRLSDALTYSKRVQKVKPNDPGFLDTYAFVLLKNGQYSEADKTIERALREYTKQGQMTIPAEVYEHKGMIKEKLEKNEEALTAYKRALNIGLDYFSQKTKDRINQAIERVSP